jgi:DNA-binding NarL/FixJ family response regulator
VALNRTITLNILVVDDHELTRCTLKILLARQPFVGRVIEATDGKQGILQAQKYQPDVVLLDLQMPVLDGWNASQEIRRLCPKTKIIAYSAVECEQVAHLLADGIIDGFCDKEVCSTKLLDMMRSLC